MKHNYFKVSKLFLFKLNFKLNEVKINLDRYDSHLMIVENISSRHEQRTLGKGFCQCKDLYQVYKTLKKLYGFATVRADRANLGNTKTAKQKLKYATFKASFFMFSGLLSTH